MKKNFLFLLTSLAGILMIVSSCQKNLDVLKADEVLGTPLPSSTDYCRIESIWLNPGAPSQQFRLITYNEFENPIFITNPMIVTGSPFRSFKYDTWNRLREYLESYSNNTFETWHFYGYDLQGRIGVDTSYTFGSSLTGKPTNYLYRTISLLTYDAQNRIVQSSNTITPDPTNPMVPPSSDVQVWSYNSAGNREGPFGDPVVNITFGSGDNPGEPLPNIVPGAITSLSYVAVYGNPAIPIPQDGQYTITNNVPSNDFWFKGVGDHTPGDINGYMAFFNSQETAGLEFYNQKINNLHGSTTYQFATWIANCLISSYPDGVKPDITFRIEQTDGTLLASYNTGPIEHQNSLTWQQFRFDFTTPPTVTTVIAKMTNNNPGGVPPGGNDFAIDDITLRPCGPGITYDNKVNLNRTNDIWMFLARDYSMNNPFTASSYNTAGYPTTINVPFARFILSNDIFISNSQIGYGCRPSNFY